MNKKGIMDKTMIIILILILAIVLVLILRGIINNVF